MAPSTSLAFARRLGHLVPAVRAAAAVSACLIAGQFAGQTGLGLAMAVGARRVVLSDPGGAPASRVANMALAAATGSLAAFAGTLAGHSLALATLGMFALGWVAGVARSRSEAGGRLAMSPAILFALAQILPGDVQSAAVRALAVGVGGTVAVVLVVWAYPHGWPSLAVNRLRTGLHFLWDAVFSSEGDVRFGFVLAATVSVCLLVVRALELPRGYWVVVSVLVVLRPEAAVTRQRGFERVAGTLLGSALEATGPAPFLERPPASSALNAGGGGGGMASMRIDPQGKAYGQMALEMTIPVPVSITVSGSPNIAATPAAVSSRSAVRSWASHTTRR